jgi:hypothetical protein
MVFAAFTLKKAVSSSALKKRERRGGCGGRVLRFFEKKLGKNFLKNIDKS